MLKSAIKSTWNNPALPVLGALAVFAFIAIAMTDMKDDTTPWPEVQEALKVSY